MAEKIENGTDAENRAVSRAELRADPCADAGALTRAKCGIFATTALGLCHIDTLMALYEKMAPMQKLARCFAQKKLRRCR